MPIFSIIIPTFNSAASIENCISSILAQTYNNFEILVIDGLSTDNTAILINKFDDERLSFFSEQDAGIYDAMNKGIKKSRGKWLFFLGSDDLLYERNVLSKIHDYIKTTTAKFVYGNVKIVGNVTWAKDGEIYKGETTITDLFKINICHQSIFYAREVFENKRYDLRFKILADYDINIYCASQFTMGYAPIIISYFNAGGISSSREDECFNHNKWINIVLYYRFSLIDKEYIFYRHDIKKIIIPALKMSNYKLSFIALIIFIGLKCLKFFKS